VPASATFLHEIYKVPYEAMELLPLGADTELANSVRGTGAGRTLRRSLGIPDDHRVIFTGGKLTPAKKTELLFEAVARLASPSLHIVVVGQADKEHSAYEERLRHLATTVPNVHMVGWLNPEGIYRHMDMADLAVFPASQSILWQQTIAMGLPLVVGDIGHQDVSYLNSEQSIVILRRDEIRADRLADVIAGLLGDPERMQAMGEGALRVADQQLNWDRLVQRTLRFNGVEPSTVPSRH
jgi:glycosyltransferase involved in cell wall biosynthesis